MVLHHNDVVKITSPGPRFAELCEVLDMIDEFTVTLAHGRNDVFPFPVVDVQLIYQHGGRLYVT